jgi:hypothetical protein
LWQPPVRKQRGKWVVRVDGIDTVTGKVKRRGRPRSLQTPPDDGGAVVAVASTNVDVVVDVVEMSGTCPFGR